MLAYMDPHCWPQRLQSNEMKMNSRWSRTIYRIKSVLTLLTPYRIKSVKKQIKQEDCPSA